MNKEIEAIAEALGQALKEKPEAKAYYQAKEAYESDIGLQKNLILYAAAKHEIQEELGKQERDTLYLDEMEARLEQLYENIHSNPRYEQYVRAKNEIQTMLSGVQSRIAGTVMGEAAQCGNCSGCRKPCPEAD